MADGGSPPRMRGKLADGLGEAYTGRITPAHAGKTRFESATKYYPTDHPRACGENTTTVIVIPERSGSPPRMRGKPRKHVRADILCRITPAHAGKTSTA